MAVVVLFGYATRTEVAQAARCTVGRLQAYLRALLKIPTDDQDLDAMPQAGTEEDQIAARARGQQPRPDGLGWQ